MKNRFPGKKLSYSPIRVSPHFDKIAPDSLRIIKEPQQKIKAPEERPSAIYKPVYFPDGPGGNYEGL